MSLEALTRTLETASTAAQQCVGEVAVLRTKQEALVERLEKVEKLESRIRDLESLKGAGAASVAIHGKLIFGAITTLGSAGLAMLAWLLQRSFG